MLDSYMFTKSSTVEVKKPVLNTVFLASIKKLPRALLLSKYLDLANPVSPKVWAMIKKNLLAFLAAQPGSEEFKENSVRSRSTEDNTVDKNLKYLNDVIFKYGAFMSIGVKVGRELESNTFVYSCGSNASGDMADPIAFRRCVENGFAHYVMKEKQGSVIKSTFGLLANRLTVSTHANNEVVSVSVPGDKASLYRYLTVHQVLFFHEFERVLIGVTVDSRALAKKVASLPEATTHTFFLDQLLADGLVYGSFAVDYGEVNDPYFTDLATRKVYRPDNAPCVDTLKLGVRPITPKCDQSKAILAISKRFCFTAIGQKDLQASLKELGGSIPLNLSTGMASTRKVAEEWLKDPRFLDFILSPSVEDRDALIEAHGRIPCSYAREGRLKTRVYFVESDVYETEGSLRFACLFSALLGLEKDLAVIGEPVTIDNPMSPASVAEAAVKEYVRTADVPLVEHVKHCVIHDLGDVVMCRREKKGPLQDHELKMKWAYRDDVDSREDTSGLKVFVTDGSVEILLTSYPFPGTTMSRVKYKVDRDKLVREPCLLDVRDSDGNYLSPLSDVHDRTLVGAHLATPDVLPVLEVGSYQGYLDLVGQAELNRLLK